MAAAFGDIGLMRPRSGWADRWFDLRNRLIGNERFRGWAGRFPLTRGVARRQARALFDLCAGFVYSQVLLAAVQLDLFEILAEGPLSAGQLAARTGLPLASMRRLLDAAVSLKLLDRRRADHFGLGPLGATLIENPGVVAMIEHHAMAYRDLADPVALLRQEAGETELQRYWSYAGSDRTQHPSGQDSAAYSTLMSTSQTMIAEQILAAYPLSRHHHLMDVGGGEGVFLRAAAAKYPQLRLTLFDLPTVTSRAAERFSAAGLSSHTAVVGGDFRSGSLPEGADLVTLIRVLHDHDDDVALGLLQAIREVLPVSGSLILAEPFADTDGAEPIGHAYFGFYLMAMGSGRPRTVAEITALLRAAGFSRTTQLKTDMPMVVGVIRARA